MDFFFHSGKASYFSFSHMSHHRPMLKCVWFHFWLFSDLIFLVTRMLKKKCVCRMVYEYSRTHTLKTHLFGSVFFPLRFWIFSMLGRSHFRSSHYFILLYMWFFSLSLCIIQVVFFYFVRISILPLAIPMFGVLKHLFEERLAWIGKLYGSPAIIVNIIWNEWMYQQNGEAKTINDFNMEIILFQ